MLREFELSDSSESTMSIGAPTRFLCAPSTPSPPSEPVAIRDALSNKRRNSTSSNNHCRVSQINPNKPIHLHAPVYKEVPMVSASQTARASSMVDLYSGYVRMEPVVHRKVSFPLIKNSVVRRPAINMSMGNLASDRRTEESSREPLGRRRSDSGKSASFLSDFDRVLSNTRPGDDLVKDCDRFLKSVPSRAPVPPPKPRLNSVSSTTTTPAYRRSLSESLSAQNSPAPCLKFRATSEQRYDRSVSTESVNAIPRPTFLRRTSDSRLAENFKKRNSLILEREKCDSMESISEGAFLRRALEADKEFSGPSRVRDSPFLRRNSCDLSFGNSDLLELASSAPIKPPRKLSLTKIKPPPLTANGNREIAPPVIAPPRPQALPLSAVSTIVAPQEPNPPPRILRRPSANSLKYQEDFVDPVKPSKVKIFDANFEGISDRSSSDISVDWAYPSSGSDHEPELKRLMDFSHDKGTLPTEGIPLLRDAQNPDLSESLRSASVNSALNEFNATFKELEVNSKKKRPANSESNCVIC